MLAISPDSARVIEALSAKQDMPANQRSHFHKWLRYYLDFCQSYSFEHSETQNFSAFDEKPRAKNPSGSQRQQAKQVVAVYYKGIVSHQVAGLKNQGEAMVQTKFQNRRRTVFYWPL